MRARALANGKAPEARNTPISCTKLAYSNSQQNYTSGATPKESVVDKRLHRAIFNNNFLKGVMTLD